MFGPYLPHNNWTPAPKGASHRALGSTAGASWLIIAIA